MSIVGNSLRIPNFISAESPVGLRRLMLRNNLKNSKEYQYFNIQFVNGRWFAWYLEIEDENKILSNSKAKGG